MSRFDLKNRVNYYHLTTYTIFAEREGFEPPEPFSSTVFKTAVIDHSTTSPYVPKLEHYSLNSNRIANIVIFRIVTNYFQLFNCCYIASILHSALILYILVVTVTLLQLRYLLFVQFYQYFVKSKGASGSKGLLLPNTADSSI